MSTQHVVNLIWVNSTHVKKTQVNSYEPKKSNDLTNQASQSQNSFFFFQLLVFHSGDCAFLICWNVRVYIFKLKIYYGVIYRFFFSCVDFFCVSFINVIIYRWYLYRHVHSHPKFWSIRISLLRDITIIWKKSTIFKISRTLILHNTNPENLLTNRFFLNCSINNHITYPFFSFKWIYWFFRIRVIFFSLFYVSEKERIKV